MKVQLGRYYRTKGGVIVGAMEENKDWVKDTYPYSTNGLTFTENGRFYADLDLDYDGEWDLVEDVTHLFKPTQSPQPHTFPTLDEFTDWWNDTDTDRINIYDFFKSRVQPLEIGNEYEMSNGVITENAILNAFVDNNGNEWKHIRPVQVNRREQVIDALDKIINGNWAGSDRSLLEDAIKMLEGKK